MASIPLPALSVRAPEPPPDLMQRYAQFSQLRNSQLQSTALEQENQMRAQTIKDQQAMTAAMHQWDGKDFESLIPLASKNGASATAVMGLKQKNLEIKDKYSQIAKNDAETGEKNLTTLKGRNDMVAGGINSVLDAPDEELSSRLLATAQDLGQKGVLDPQHVQMAQQMAQADPKTLRAQLGIFKKSFQADSQQMEDAQKAATAARENADARKTNLEANQMEQSGAMSPMVADSKYRMIQQKLIQKQPVTPDEAAWAKSYEKQKELNTQVRVNAMGQQREYPVLDTKNGNSLQYISAADLNAANHAQPGRYVPAGEGGKALNKTALIEDIRGTIQQARASLQNPKMPEFTATQRSAIALALGGPEPSTALSAAFRGGVLGSLTPEQQDYLINHAQLVENAMAMRSVLGAGQGSDDMRRAIKITIPGPNTPSKEYALKQLDKFEATLNRLSRGVPNVPLRDAPERTPSGKSLSMAQVQQAAKDHNISVDEAKKQAIAQGYSVQ